MISQAQPSAEQQKPSATFDLRVGGMDCASCAAAIDGALKRVDGVESVDVDVVGGRVRVRYAEGKVSRGDLHSAVRRVGYSVEDDEARTKAGTVTAPSFWTRRGRMVMTVVSGTALALALTAHSLGAARSVGTVLLALSAIAGGWYVVPRGLRAARNLALDMNFLMSVAAAGAWIIGEQTEAAATLFLFAIAELLEAYSMDRARMAIRSLMDLSPAEATVVRGGVEMRVAVGEIAVGETVIVRPGEKIAVDGEVARGRSSVNQAPITGESMPVDKEPGLAVFAGSLNVQGVLEVRSTKPATDTTLARIIHSVEEAQASRAPSQTFVDRFARIYTPSVVAIAVLIAVVPPLAGAGSFGTWVYRALAMLVVACPCALVISTPVSIVSGLARAARRGILIKGGAQLERAGTLTTVAFDKTGTLTEGRPVVTDVIPATGSTEDAVIGLAMAVEQSSEHPLAGAILEYGRGRALSPPTASDFVSFPGRGARAVVGGRTIAIGNARLAEEDGASLSGMTAEIQRLENAGKTIVLVRSDRSFVGIIALADTVRSGVFGALSDLRAAGIRRTVMLTGDNERVANQVCHTLQLTEYHSGLLPDDKLRIIREMQSRGERVAFVGDGVNDAPALAAATVGIAMGVAGSDVAIETADIALMSDDLSALAFALRLSRRTATIIKQNIIFAIGIKVVFVVLAVTGVATLWMAVAADMGASLLVVANGLRVFRTR